MWSIDRPFCLVIYKKCDLSKITKNSFSIILQKITKPLIVPVLKKRKLQLMTSYRVISLMSIAAKAYKTMLLNRIYPEIFKIFGPNQAIFRKQRSCIIEDVISKYNLDIHIKFIDFNKAFDSIHRNIMFTILRHYGIPEEVI